MDQDVRMPDLNSERVFRLVEKTKVYLLKVTFNLRTLLFNAPKEGKLKHALKRYRRAVKNIEEPALADVSDKVASELIYQHYRFSGLDDVYTKANEKYSDLYDDLMLKLKKLKRVKSFAGWKATSQKRKMQIFNETKEINRMLKKEDLEDMNRLLFNRARVLGAKKTMIWNEYKKDPAKYEDGLEEYI